MVAELGFGPAHLIPQLGFMPFCLPRKRPEGIGHELKDQGMKQVCVCVFMGVCVFYLKEGEAAGKKKSEIWVFIFLGLMGNSYQSFPG